jgi:hypothetical protein
MPDKVPVRLSKSISVFLLAILCLSLSFSGGRADAFDFSADNSASEKCLGGDHREIGNVETDALTECPLPQKNLTRFVLDTAAIQPTRRLPLARGEVLHAAVDLRAPSDPWQFTTLAAQFPRAPSIF